MNVSDWGGAGLSGLFNEATGRTPRKPSVPGHRRPGDRTLQWGRGATPRKPRSHRGGLVIRPKGTPVPGRVGSARAPAPSPRSPSPRTPPLHPRIARRVNVSDWGGAGLSGLFNEATGRTPRKPSVPGHRRPGDRTLQWGRGATPRKPRSHRGGLVIRPKGTPVPGRVGSARAPAPSPRSPSPRTPPLHPRIARGCAGAR